MTNEKRYREFVPQLDWSPEKIKQKAKEHTTQHDQKKGEK